MNAHSPVYGAFPENRIPEQDGEKVMLLAQKFSLAVAAQEPWATRAKKCIEYLESKQWTDEERMALERTGRSALTFNKIAPLWRLVIGFQANNRTDVRYLPGHDGTGTEDVAQALTHVFKQVSEVNSLPFEDQQVFADGIATGRGWWRHTLDFSENDFGEIKIRNADPFSVYPDPEANTYDLNQSANYIQNTRWASIDEIEWSLGKQVAELVRPYTRGQSWNGFSSLILNQAGEITATRTFAEEEDDELGATSTFRDIFQEHFIDPARKNIRVLETEYKTTEWRMVFIDLETGDRKTIPKHWDRQKVEKVLYHAQSLGNRLVVKRRPVESIRWVIQVGDIIAYDDWSPYETFSFTGYFPYFRRGITRGMIEDLMDPQDEYNKRRMTRLELMRRIANGGWMFTNKTFNPMQRANLRRFGSTPGVHVEYESGQEPPIQIEAQNIPAEHAQLEETANQDIRDIGGINDSALGQLDRVQSGTAIEARQRQAVIGLQLYIDNYKRSKELQGRKVLNLVQRHYTEERVIRILGEDGKLVQQIINQPQMDPMGRFMAKLNDVTVGKYAVSIDDQPMSASFRDGQYQEALALWDKLAPFAGPALPAMADVMIDMSSMPRKDEIKGILRQALGMGTALGTGIVPVPGGQPPGGAGAAPPALPQQPAVPVAA